METARGAWGQRLEKARRGALREAKEDGDAKPTDVKKKVLWEGRGTKKKDNRERDQ